MIVAADANWAIGNKGQLLVRIPADHKMFRQETEGKVVVCGRRTLDTFPGGQPLPDRTNIILSKDKDLKIKNAEVAHSIEELMEKLSDYDTDDVFIVGGASVYEALLPYTDTVHVTRIDHSYEADTYFPDLDKDSEWEITAESDEQVYFDITYTYIKYERKN